MDNGEQRSHARGVYPTQYTSRMGTSRVKQEEEIDTRIMQESSNLRNLEERNVSTKRGNLNQDLISANWMQLLSSQRDASHPTID